MSKKLPIPEKIDRQKIEYAELDSRARNDDDFQVFVDTSGTALNLIMDKIDELISYLESKGGQGE